MVCIWVFARFTFSFLTGFIRIEIKLTIHVDNSLIRMVCASPALSHLASSAPGVLVVPPDGLFLFVEAGTEAEEAVVTILFGAVHHSVHCAS